MTKAGWRAGWKERHQRESTYGRPRIAWELAQACHKLNTLHTVLFQKKGWSLVPPKRSHLRLFSVLLPSLPFALPLDSSVIRLLFLSCLHGSARSAHPLCTQRDLGSSFRSRRKGRTGLFEISRLSKRLRPVSGVSQATPRGGGSRRRPGGSPNSCCAPTRAALPHVPRYPTDYVRQVDCLSNICVYSS